MKKRFLLSTVLWLFIIPCFSQEIFKSNGNERGEDFGISACNSFVNVLYHYDDRILLKTLEFSIPNSRAYNHLVVCQNGVVFQTRVVKDWAVQDSFQTKLTFEQLQKVKQILSSPNFQSSTISDEPKDREKFTKLIFFNGKKYSQINYSGSLPDEVQEVLNAIRTEIRKQRRSIYESSTSP